MDELTETCRRIEASLERIARLVGIDPDELGLGDPAEKQRPALQLVTENNWRDFLTGHPELGRTFRPAGDEQILTALRGQVEQNQDAAFAADVTAALYGIPGEEEGRLWQQQLGSVGHRLGRMANEGRTLRFLPRDRGSAHLWSLPGFEETLSDHARRWWRLDRGDDA